VNKLHIFAVTMVAALGAVGVGLFREGGQAVFDETADASPVARGAAPNFVILIADDLGWNDLGAYGNRQVHTPNIDRLAASGLRFDNAFLTTSSCSASRASILTGKYPHSNGLVHLHQPLSPKETTLGLLLRQGGYHTEAVGKWGLGGEVKGQFSSNIEEKTGSSTERWIERLQRRPKDTPFFFWLASRDPHPPHRPDKDSVAYRYDPDKLEIPAGLVNGPGTRREFAQYYREITRFDRDVGLVVAELEAQGVLDDTLLIVMSDNGRPFPGAKENLYDDGIRTPFILYWPQEIRQPGTRGQLISMVDLAPTLLDLAGLPIPAEMQGYSFAGLLARPDGKIRDYIYAERNWHGLNYHERAIRSLDYLYKENQFPLHGLCNPSPYAGTAAYKELLQAYQSGQLEAARAECFAPIRATVELLDVDSDGNARQGNQAGDPDHAGTLETMAAALRQWRRETGDFDYTPYVPPPGKHCIELPCTQRRAGPGSGPITPQSPGDPPAGGS
jgi:arylsulfatase A-like enzyme